MENTVYFLLAVLGLILGSFAGAQVWRLRLLEIKEIKKDAKNGDKESREYLEDLSKKENHALKLLNKNSQQKDVTKDRSMCLECGHQLHIVDLLPLVSWLSTSGKCRYCKKSIGYFEPLMEFGVAVFFVASYLFWPVELSGVLDYSIFITWLVTGVVMAVLVAYDMKWMLLPNSMNLLLFVLGGLFSLLMVAKIGFSFTVLGEYLTGVLFLAGLYAVLHFASRGKWVGFGDVKLCLGLGLFMTGWKLAFLSLFLANLAGTLVIIPLMLAKKITRKTKMPFGPFLILGGVLTVLFGQKILYWYFSLSGLLFL